MSQPRGQRENTHVDEREVAFASFQERNRRDRRIQEETLSTLAAILEQPAATPSVTEGEPLFMAAAAVGEALGVRIHPLTVTENQHRTSEPIEAMARASHLRVRRVRLTGTWWRHDVGPLIAYTQEDQLPVALLPASPTRCDLFNPVDKTRVPIDAQLASTLVPVAYTLYRPFPAGALRWYDLLRFGLRGRRGDLLVALLTGIAATLLGMLVPQATGLLIDNAIPDADRGLVLQLGLALLVAAFGQTLFQIVQSFALMRQKIVAGASLQTAMWDRLMKLKNSFFRYYSTGDLQARVTSMSAIQEQLSGATLRTLFTSILASLNLGLMCYYDLSLAFIAFVVALVASLMTASAGVLTLRYMRPLHRLKGELSGIAVQLIHGMAKLRVAGAEARAFAHWGQHYSQQQILQRRVQCIQDSMTVVNSVLPALALVVLFWAAMQALLNPETTENKSLTAGTFLAFHAAFSVFVGGATSLSNALIELADVATLWERAKPIVEADLEADETKVDPGQLSGKLSVDHVTFRYERDGHIRLDDVSLHAEPGEFIALVGPSGSGKSTLLRVLLGLEAPESGAVRYDDQDLSRLDAVAIRRQIGTVLQQNTIMAGTIFENLAAGGLITIDDAWEAIRAAGLEEEIAAMPMQMNTFVGDGGGNLSGGQRQRLLIARSIVRKPAIVLFDEATSALDNHTQAMVTASLERLRATRVMIAHRLSTIQHADRIYVIDGGRIVQQGYFDELARQEGLFANLMAQQTS